MALSFVRYAAGRVKYYKENIQQSIAAAITLKANCKHHLQCAKRSSANKVIMLKCS